MLLTTFSTEPYRFINNNHDPTSYSYSDRYSKSGQNFQGKMVQADHFFPGILVPQTMDQNFRDRSTVDYCSISETVVLHFSQ